MKKIITVLFAVLAMSSMFAYIPKKDCVKVKRNKIKYYEKTEVWNLFGEEPDPKDTGFFGDSRDCEEWVIDKDMTVERSIDISYKFLEKYRKGYREKMEWEEYYSLRNMLRFAKMSKHEASNYKQAALISIPFTTEENWLTITKEEILTKMKAFIEEVKHN